TQEKMQKSREKLMFVTFEIKFFSFADSIRTIPAQLSTLSALGVDATASCQLLNFRACPKSEFGQGLIEVSHGLDASKIVFQQNVLVRGMGIFVGQAKTQHDARHLERVVHLSDKGNRAAFADKNGALAESRFERLV